jgi:hypothetical protein
MFRWLLLIVAWPGLALAAGPTELNVFFRSGQSFITWKESGADKYSLYRSDKPIADVKTATLLAEVAPGSSKFATEARKDGHYLEKVSGKQGYGLRYVIQDNGDCDPSKMPAQDTGLFVHTAHQAGKFYYAVADADGAVGPGNSLAQPVEEKPQPAGAVLVYRKASPADGGAHRIYTHWMDDADWNPKPTGGYAFNFGLALPDSKKSPGLLLRLHAYGCRYEVYGPQAGGVMLVVDDPNWDWYYGYRNPAGTQVVNYSERRMIQTVELALRLAAEAGCEVDRGRIQINGGSMGGSGANLLAAMHGDLFAAATTNKGMVNYNMTARPLQTAEKNLWGTRQEDLPANTGDRAWNHMDLIRWHLANVGRETAFIVDTHSSTDEILPFDPVPEYYQALQKARRPFVAIWAPVAHMAAIDPPAWRNYPAWPSWTIRIDETVPAIGYATSSDAPVAGGKGQINYKVEWCCSGNDFDKGSTKDDIVDAPGRWEMCIRSLAGPQTATITPRRCQKFKAAAGKTYRWENWSFADPAKPIKAAEGTVKADEFGLVSVEKFAFGQAGWGNRLVIFPAEK